MEDLAQNPGSPVVEPPLIRSGSFFLGSLAATLPSLCHLESKLPGSFLPLGHSPGVPVTPSPPLISVQLISAHSSGLHLAVAFFGESLTSPCEPKCPLGIPTFLSFLQSRNITQDCI